MAKPATRPAPAPAKPTQPSNAVATRKEHAVAQNVPDFMKGMAGMGTENVGQSDIETPRIKLLQAVSEECETFDSAKQGHFWHNVAERNLGSDVRVVPIYVDMRAILWRPRHEGGGILARADDNMHWVPANATFEVRPYKDNKKVVKWTTKPLVAQSGLLEWGSSDPEDPNSQPAATKMFNLVVGLPDFPDLGMGVVTLQRSSIGVGKKFMGKLKLMGVPSFGTYFTMGRVKEDGKEGPYWNYSFTAAGLVQDPDEFNEYKMLYERFKAMGLQIKDLEGAQEDTVQGSADPNAPAY